MSVGTEDFWADLKRSIEVSRDHNQQVMDAQIGAIAASALAFNNQMLAGALLHPGGNIQATEEQGNGTSPNP